MLLFGYSFSHSQEFNIGISTGLGSYGMWDLKEVQDDLLNEIDIPNLAVTESFPSFFTFGVNLDLLYSNYTITFLSRYESTGGRISYSDYSGSYSYDQLAKQLLIGIGFKKYSSKGFLSSISTLRTYFEIKSGAAFSFITFIEEVRIGTGDQDQSLDLEETAAFVEPSFGISIPYGNISIEPYAGMHIAPFKSGLHLAGEPDAKLQDNNGNIHSEWFGVRIGVNVMIKI